MNVDRLKWPDISKYRNEMYGIAIISIMVLHYSVYISGADGFGNAIRNIARLYNGAVGSVGVDIFLFLSEFCICYSLAKGGSVRSFFKKRFYRVVVPYLILGGIFWVLQELLLPGDGLLGFIYNYSLLSFWCGGVRTFWYISLICCLYAISPAIYSRGKKGMLLSAAAACVISIVIYAVSREVFSNIEIAILRIPIYFIGMYCGTLSLENKTISRKLIAALALSVPVKAVVGLRDASFARLFNTPYAIFMILCYILLRSHMRKDGWLFAFLSKAGGYSLELYIVHVAVRALMGTAGLNLARPEIYGACILISVPISVGYSKLHSAIFKRCQ